MQSREGMCATTCVKTRARWRTWFASQTAWQPRSNKCVSICVQQPVQAFSTPLPPQTPPNVRLSAMSGRSHVAPRGGGGGGRIRPHNAVEGWRFPVMSAHRHVGMHQKHIMASSNVQLRLAAHTEIRTLRICLHRV